MVVTVCDLIEKFECAGKFILCGSNVTRKYWLIADRPNMAKKCGHFRPLFRFYGGTMALFYQVLVRQEIFQPLVGFPQQSWVLCCIQDTLSSRTPLGRVRRASKGILHTRY